MSKFNVLLPLFLISFLSIFSAKNLDRTNQPTEMTLCVSPSEVVTNKAAKVVLPTNHSATITNSFEYDSTKNYSMPLFTKTKTGEVILSWTEKDTQGIVSFCLAFSKDKGKMIRFLGHLFLSKIKSLHQFLF